MSDKYRSVDVVIAGGGVIGLTIARALAQRGVRDVCVIERSALGTEASFAAGGILAPQAEANGRDEFFELACRSRDLYPEFAAALYEETGVDVELDATGTLYVAFTDGDVEEIEKRYEWQSRAGLDVERLTAAEARELEPCVAENVRGALRFPRDIQVENRRLLSALVNSVDKLGVKIASETNVESVRIGANRITGVQTSRGFISCQTIIIAAGTWSSTIEQSRTPRIEPVRGQMICFDAKPQLTRHVIYSPRGYLVPRHDGRLIAGSTSENAGFTKQVTAGGISHILANAHEISPGISTLPILDTWSGLRPRAADGLPVLGPCDEIDGLFYATGHYRNGILLAPVTGELIAEAVVAGHISPLLAAFSPNRFDLAHVS
ncbi:MAG TPA: glycine oxidase ThiO [Pyrinomonadaceae bacterium]|nr:glycine oxidase ThiO [Pyrinomonadaceae bacterium]